MASDGLIDGLDRQELVRILAFELAGLGPLEIYLDDSDVRAIFVNGSEHIYLRGESGGERAARHFSEARALQLAAERLIRLSQKVDSHVYAARFADGTRVELVVPPAANEPLITVRKRPESYRSLEQLVEAGVLSQEMATFARHVVEARRNVLVAGPVNSGKTELLNALGSTIDDGTRIVVVEETERLRLPQQSLVSLEWANLGDAANRVMGYALRLQPERLIVDDIGPAIAYDWILGTAFSALGSIAAVGATGDRDALTRLESMALSRAPMLSLRGVREQIARAVNIVMVLAKTPGGQNRVTQVVEVQGLELETVRLQDVFFYQRGGDGASFQATGHIPAFYEELRRSGIDSDLSIFRS
jgi:pilus assembly protein CpaF